VSRRRVLVLAHAGGSPHHGPNMRWYHLGRALAPMGVDVEIVSSSFFHKYLAPPRVFAPLQEDEVDGLRYHWIRTRPYRRRGLGQLRNQWDFVRGCLRFSRRLAARRPDAVVAVSPHPFTAVAAARVARLAGAPLVFEVHDLWPQVLVELGRIRPWHPYAIALRAAERFAVRRADLLVSLKPGDIDHLAERHGASRDRFLHSPNGISPPPSPTGDPPEAFREIRGRYRFLVGYVGAISAYYCLERLADLAKRLHDHTEIGFVAIGAGDRRDHLVAGMAERGLRNLHLIDAVPPTTVPAILSGLDAGYLTIADLPLHRHGISCTKIAEYMHAGLPILGAYRAGHDPVAKAGCGLVFPPDDLDGLTAGVLRLASDPHLRAAMSQRGRAHFDAHLHIDRIAGTLARALLDAGDGAARRGPHGSLRD